MTDAVDEPAREIAVAHGRDFRGSRRHYNSSSLLRNQLNLMGWTTPAPGIGVP